MAVAAKAPTMKLVKNKGVSKAAVAAAAAEVKEQEESGAVAMEPVEIPETEVSEVETSGKDEISEVVEAYANLKETRAFQMVPSLLDDIEHNFFKLGGVLSRIRDQGWFMNKGYENFKGYIEAETPLGYRKAMFLVSIYSSLVSSGVEWAKVKHLGWTKLRELVLYLTQSNLEEMLLAVNGMTVLQIQAYLNTLTKGAGAAGGASDPEKAVSTVTTMTFKVHADQKETIRAALDKCKHEISTEVDTVALEHICLDFLGGESKVKIAPSLKELMVGKSAEEILEVFSEVYPAIELTATMS